MTAGGYFGRALITDASTGTAEILELPDDILRAYIGGAGLGAWLMHRLGAPEADPLCAEAPLAYVFSPLVGTPPRNRPCCSSTKPARASKTRKTWPG